MDSKTDKQTRLSVYGIWREGAGVKRFHTVPLVGEQTVGQHSWGVAALINLLWPNCSKEVIVAALNHDIAEGLMGDVPAPAKWANPDLKEIMTRIEKEQEEKWELTVILTPDETLMLKAADMLELILFSRDQQNLGNKSFQVITKRGIEYMYELFTDNAQRGELLQPALELLIQLTHDVDTKKDVYELLGKAQ